MSIEAIKTIKKTEDDYSFGVYFFINATIHCHEQHCYNGLLDIIGKPSILSQVILKSVQNSEFIKFGYKILLT